MVRTATEVHGGIGFTDDCDLHFWFKRAALGRAAARRADAAPRARRRAPGLDGVSERAVIVGAGQLRRRPGLDFPDADWEPQEPVTVVAEALRRAAADAGRPSLIEEADAIGWVPAVSWGYEDAPASLAQALGRTAPRTGWACAPGGDGGVQVLNDAANRIAEGEVKIALVGGCEVLYSRRRARAQGVELEKAWTPGGSSLRFIGGDAMRFSNELERRHGVVNPVSAYPFLENALRAAAGRSIDEHQAFLGRALRALRRGRERESRTAGSRRRARRPTSRA